MENDDSERNKRLLEALSSPSSRKAALALAAGLAGRSAIVEVRLGSERNLVLMAAIAARIDAEPGLSVLVVAPGDRDVASLKTAFDASGGRLGLSCSTIGRDGVTEGVAVAIGSLDAIASCTASGLVEPGDYGLVALSDLDAMTDVANAAMLRRAIGPASKTRRLLAFSSDPGPVHHSIARDLGGPLVELDLEAEGERARSASVSTLAVAGPDKARLLLGLLQSGLPKPVAVFCALRDTAEAAARSLRAGGINTEFIVGNLPRKQAVLEGLKAGRHDVLVLTDDGAAGLPAAWAGTLVNWDLPLEGEPYMARLEHLNASRTEARVCNFACDRYSFGLPAIERILGSRLTIEPVDESIMARGSPAAQAASGRAGRPGTAGRRQNQKPEPKGRGSAKQEAPRRDVPRSASPRTPERQQGAGPGDGRRDQGDYKRREAGDHGNQYDGRNTRAIQADIAAITGGMSPAVGESASSPEVSAAKKKKRRRKGKPESGARAPAEGGNPRARGKAVQRLTDPYSVSMEERLRLYRECYAKNADSKPADAKAAGGKPANGGRGQPSRRKNGQGSGPKAAGGSGRHPDQRSGRSAPGAQSDPGQTDAVQKDQKQAPDKGHVDTGPTAGILGALRGLFGGKPD